MKLSIIIPSYNRKDTLKLQLEKINNQENLESLDFEVVVVDDGSDDGTKQMVDELAILYKLRYIFLNRDEHSSRARARNQGVNNSTGEILTFLDSGILPTTTFIKNLIKYFEQKNNENRVILHYTYGLFASNEHNLKVKNYEEFVEEVREHIDWRDVREDIFNHISPIEAPWALGWSCMLTISRKKFFYVDGFDETFKNWGGEDSEFAFKLHEIGCEFEFDKVGYGIHIPHDSGEEKDINLKVKSSQINRGKIYKLHPNIQTELYTIFPSQVLNQFINIVNSYTVGQMIITSYSTKVTKRVKEDIQKYPKSLLVGFDNYNQINDLSPTNIFFFNKNSYNNFEAMNIKKHHIFGICTRFENQYFDCVYLSDFARALPTALFKEVIKELYRISSRFYILYTKNYRATFSQISNSPWLKIADLEAILNELNLKVVEIIDAYNETTFEIIDARQWFSGNTQDTMK